MVAFLVVMVAFLVAMVAFLVYNIKILESGRGALYFHCLSKGLDGDIQGWVKINRTNLYIENQIVLLQPNIVLHY